MNTCIILKCHLGSWQELSFLLPICPCSRRRMSGRRRESVGEIWLAFSCVISLRAIVNNVKLKYCKENTKAHECCMTFHRIKVSKERAKNTKECDLWPTSCEYSGLGTPVHITSCPGICRSYVEGDFTGMSSDTSPSLLAPFNGWTNHKTHAI